MDGLTVKDGRLMNFRRDGETGIAEAARLRGDMKGAKLVRQIADGIELSEERKVMRDIFGPPSVSVDKKWLKK